MWILKVLTKYRNWNARFKAYYQFHLYVKTQPFDNIESTFCNLNFKLTNHNRPHERLGSETNFTFKNQYYNFVGWIVWNKNTITYFPVWKSDFIGKALTIMEHFWYATSFDRYGVYEWLDGNDGVEHWTWFALKIDIL